MASTSKTSQFAGGHTGTAKPLEVSYAAKAWDLDKVPGLINSLAKRAQTLTADDRESRHAMADQARALVLALEAPRETMARQCAAEPVSVILLMWAIEIGLIQAMFDAGRPRTIASLAQQLSVQESLLARTMRHLAAMGHIDETGVDTYQLTSFSKSLTMPVIGNSYLFFRAVGWKSFLYLNKFFRKNGMQAATRIDDTPMQFAHRTGLHFFHFLAANPPMDLYFNQHMGGYKLGRPLWTDVHVYPVRERLLRGFPAGDSSAVLLVDIGGGLGHDLGDFHRAFPDAPGRLVLEDLPPVIASSLKEDGGRLPPKIERLGHDFLTEQPIKGARAYYLHSVLHDWPDEDCLPIVARIREAMRPGYSRLLVNDQVVPARGAHWETTYMDIMMLNFASHERTEAEWHDLLERQCGLRINKIYSAGAGAESLIECELPAAN